ncbi:hypothetical protein [Vibrio vulnificus]|uniref:hypothetical protein n=1 Tax=Vibrio vulnificus TaxID=672 RepID=UPI001028B2FB|nr:hypothetical protein [Vibrio vulnificus]RZP95250.1 hypothetical protein D8T54_13770 [Vibrio vulnificus]
MNRKLKCSLISLALMPLAGNAIGIDSMMEFTQDNKANFTVTNPAEFRQFLHVGISELTVKDGELESIPYSRDNIDDWTLSVRPARTVIDSGLNKTFQVMYEPHDKQEQEKDKAYQLSFIPTPYFEKGEEVTHRVQVAVGFAPVVIVPAVKDKPIDYRMRYNEDKTLTLKNNGGTYLRAFLDACPKGTKDADRKSCTTVVYALSGRDLPISLPEGMQDANIIKVKLSTHYLKYKHEFTLQPGLISEGKEG